MSPKWVSAMKFAITLVKQLQPSCIEYCIRELSEIQVSFHYQLIYYHNYIIFLVISNSTMSRFTSTDIKDNYTGKCQL